MTTINRDADRRSLTTAEKINLITLILITVFIIAFYPILPRPLSVPKPSFILPIFVLGIIGLAIVTIAAISKYYEGSVLNGRYAIKLIIVVGVILLVLTVISLMLTAIIGSIIVCFLAIWFYRLRFQEFND